MNNYKVDNLESPERIDTYLIDILNISRNQIQKMIQDEKIIVNNKSVKTSYLLKNGDLISVSEIKNNEKILPEKMDLEIIYEDDDIIVINKSKDTVIHPAPGLNTGTLVNGLLYYTKDLSDVNGANRRGIVHRLDVDTTGLLVVAKNNKAHLHLAKQFEEKTVTRKYQAVVWGVINNDTGTIEAPIGRDTNNRTKLTVTAMNSKEAVTHFKVLERFNQATLIELQLETGRTHQIRVHMEYIDYPIVNDPVYGKRKLIDETGQCLHAKVLGFIHPSSGDYVEFESDLPPSFTKILEQIKLS